MSESETRPSIPAVIGTALLLAGFLLQFFSSRPTLPIEVQIVSSGIIAIAAILFIVWVWYRPVRRFFKNWRRDRIARKNYPRLVRFVERFRDFAGESRFGSSQFVFNNMKNTEGFRNLNLVDGWYTDLMSSDLERGLKTFRPNFKTFVWGADSLTSMLRFYSEVFVTKPITQIRTIIESGSGKLQPNLRDDFNASREKFVAFLNDYEEFVSQTSNELGQDYGWPSRIIA